MTNYKNTKPAEFVLEVQNGELPRLVGPFFTQNAASDWAVKNIENGTWNIAPVYSPFYEYVDGSK